MASIEKAKTLIGYEPVISFSEGLNRAIEWYKENSPT
jgi:nucleoside-diphosphate-sugar epimerase